MKVKSAREIRNILRSEPFSIWYRRFNELREELRANRIRREELLAKINMVAYAAEATHQAADEKVYEAGEYEDLSARAHAEFAEIENESFEALGEFEAQRLHATEVWGQFGRLENDLEEHRQRAADLRARVEGVRQAGRADADAEATRLEVRLKDAEEALRRLNQEVEDSRARVLEASARRDRMWGDVEVTWSRAFRANVARAEYRYQAKRVQAETEALFAKAAQERKHAEELMQEVRGIEELIASLDTQYEEHLERGRTAFECTLERDFLYWPSDDDVKTVYCVALIDEPIHFNIQVVALQIYRVERSRGVDFIEPLPEQEAVDDDPRLHAFFREGRARHAGPEPVTA